jgi:hypothetical protein
MPQRQESVAKEEVVALRGRAAFPVLAPAGAAAARVAATAAWVAAARLALAVEP